MKSVDNFLTDAFIATNLSPRQLMGVAAVSAVALLGMGYYEYRRDVLPFHAKCKHFKEKDDKESYRKCINIAQIKRRILLIQELKKLISKCSTQKNPQKCIEKIQKKIQMHLQFIHAKKENITGTIYQPEVNPYEKY